MNTSLLHTPDGVRDIYGQELMEKEFVGAALMKVMQSYGYRNIQTPTFEFFDVFSKDIGTIPSKDLYKFFDKEGNTLVLRPDFTPAIARCAAKYFMEEQYPLRFCYEGNAFVNTSELQGKLKETTQMGIELINDGSVQADAEVLMLVVDGLIACGLKEFQISVGDTSYFKGICEEANLDEETQQMIREYISSKNYFGTQEFLRKQNIAAEIVKDFEAISKIYCSDDELHKIKEHATNAKALVAIERMLSLKEVLSKHGYDKYITVDFGMLSKINYYTGIIFKAYTYGVGDAIVKGGRYDGLLEQFGKKAPSVGCAFLLDEIHTSIKRQNIKINTPDMESCVVLYDEVSYEAALKIAVFFRKNDIRVSMFAYDQTKELDYYLAYAKELGVSKLHFIENHQSKEYTV